MTTTIAGHQFAVSREDVERASLPLEPEPLDVWYVVVGHRRYPPKQVVEAVTGLDRADFNSHQARSLLTRLGFVVARTAPRGAARGSQVAPADEHGADLSRYAGRWVAQHGTEVLFDADSPEVVVGWLHRHRRLGSVWRVPATPAEAGSAASAAS